MAEKDINLYDVVMNAPDPSDTKGFENTIAKIWGLGEDVEKYTKDIAKDLEGFSRGLEKITQNIGLSHFADDLKGLIIQDLDQLRDNLRKVVALPKIDMKPIKIGNEVTKELQKELQESITKVVETTIKESKNQINKALKIKPKASPGNYRVDKAGTIFREFLNTIENKDLRSATKTRLNASPKEFWTMWASTSGKYHNAIENQRSGNVIHTGRAAMGAYSLITGGKVVPGVDAPNGTFSFTKTAMKKYRNLSQEDKDAIMAGILLHDVEKPMRGTGDKLGLTQPKYNDEHDAAVLHNTSQALLDKFFNSIDPEKMEALFKGLEDAGSLYSNDESIRKQAKEDLAKNLIGSAVHVADGIVTGADNNLNPLSPFQVRVAGGLSTDKYLENLKKKTGGYTQFDIENLKVLKAIDEQAKSQKRVEDGKHSVADVLKAFRGKILGHDVSEAAGDPRNVIDHLTSLVDENSSAGRVIGINGFVDPDLLKMHYTDPRILDNLIDRVSKNTDMNKDEKKEVFEKLSTLKKQMDMAVSNLESKLGNLTHPDKVLSEIDNQKLYDLTTRAANEIDPTKPKETKKESKSTEASKEDLKSARARQIEADARLKELRADALESNKSLANFVELERDAVEIKSKLSKQGKLGKDTPEYASLKDAAERERLALVELNSKRDEIKKQMDKLKQDIKTAEADFASWTKKNPAAAAEEVAKKQKALQRKIKSVNKSIDELEPSYKEQGKVVEAARVNYNKALEAAEQYGKTYIPSEYEKREQEKQQITVADMIKRQQILQGSGKEDAYIETQVASEMAKMDSAILANKVKQKLGIDHYVEIEKQNLELLKTRSVYDQRTLEDRIEMAGLQKDSLAIANKVKKHLADDEEYTADLAQVRKLTVKQQRALLEDENTFKAKKLKAELEVAEITEKLAKVRTEEYKQEQKMKNALAVQVIREKLSERGIDPETLSINKDAAQAYQEAKANIRTLRNMNTKLQVENWESIEAGKRFRIRLNASADQQQAQLNAAKIKADPNYVIKQLLANQRAADGQSGRSGGGYGGGSRSSGGGQKSGMRGAMYTMQQNFWALMTPLAGIQSMIALLKQSADAIKENELAAINLRRVFDGTEEDLKGLISQMPRLAVEFGDSVASVGKIQEEWAKTGKSNFDEINELTKVTELALNTADIETAEDAVKFLNSSLQQMNLEWTDAQRLLDSWNYTADQFPADTKDFAEAYSRSASYAHTLGLEVDDLNGIISVMIENTGRSGEEIGNALKMIFSNILRPKSIKALEELGVQVYERGEDGKILYNKYKPFMEIMDQISSKSATFRAATEGTDEVSASLMKLAGALGDARQRNYALALMESWSDVDKVAKVSAQGIGYSATKNEKSMDSLYKKAMQFKAGMQELSSAVGESGFLTLFKEMFDGGTAAATGFARMNPGMRDTIVLVSTLVGSMGLLNRALREFSAGNMSAIATGVAPIREMLSNLDLEGALKNIPVLNKLKNVTSLRDDIVNRTLKQDGFLDMFGGDEEKAVQAIDEALKELNISTEKSVKSKKKLKDATKTNIGAQVAENVVTEESTVANATQTASENIQTASTTAHTASVNKDTVATEVNTAVKKASAAAGAAWTLGVQAAIGALVYATYMIVTHKRRMQELNEERTKELQDMRATKAQLEDLMFQYSQASEGSEEMKEIQIKLAEVLPDTTSGFNDQGQAIANNKTIIDEAVQSYKDLYEWKIKSAADDAAENKEDTQKKLDKKEDKVKDLMDDYNRMIKMTDQEFLESEFAPGDGSIGRSEMIDAVKSQIDSLQEDIKGLRDLIKQYTEAENAAAQLSISERPDPGSKAVSGLSKSISDIDMLNEEIQTSEDDTVETLSKAAEKIIKAKGKETTAVQAARTVIKRIIPEITAEELKNKDKLMKKINEVIGKRGEELESTYQTTMEELNSQIKYAEGLLPLLQWEIALREQLIGVKKAERLIPDKPIDHWTKKQMQLEIDPGDNTDQIKYEVEQDKKAIEEVDKLLKEAKSKAADLTKSVGTVGTPIELDPTGSSDPYKALDERIKGIDRSIQLVKGKGEILDAIWKNDANNVEYLTQKNTALQNTYDELGRSITKLVAEKAKLNKVTDAEKIKEIDDKIQGYTKEQIDIQVSKPSPEKAAFQKRIANNNRELQDWDTATQVMIGTMTSGEESSEAMAMNIAKVQKSIPLIEDSYHAITGEMNRVQLEIDKNSNDWLSADSQTKEILHAKNEALREELKDLESQKLGVEKQRVDLVQTLQSIISSRVTAQLDKAREKEIKDIDIAIKKQQKKHDDFIAQKESELQALERSWNLDDYNKKIEDIDKEIAKLNEEAARYAVDDSQWAAQKRKEIEEQLQEKLKEKQEAQTEHSRDLKRDEIQDKIDAENKAHDEWMTLQEEEKEKIEEKYKTLSETMGAYLHGVLQSWQDNQFDIIEFLNQKIPEYTKVADTISTAFKNASMDVQDFLDKSAKAGAPTTIAVPTSAGGGSGTIAHYSGGGKVLEDQVAMLHKKEMVLPVRYANVMEQLADFVDMPRYSPAYRPQETTPPSSNVEVKEVIHIDEATFTDDFDYKALESQAGSALKRVLFKKGVRMG